MEWDLLIGSLVEHNVHDDMIRCLAISGNQIVTQADNEMIVRVFDIRSCLPKVYYFSYYELLLRINFELLFIIFINYYCY